jgi:hypothetical protein
VTDYEKLSDAALARKIVSLQAQRTRAEKVVLSAAERFKDLSDELALAKHTLNVRELRNRNT